MQTYSTIDEYLATLGEPGKKLISTMRSTIREVVPEAKEAIKYGMPTFTLHGNLVHFAAFKNHIGFYPAPSGILAFKEALEPYQTSKGAIQFPLDKPLPLALIKKIVAFRVKESQRKAKEKATKKKSAVK